MKKVYISFALAFLLLFSGCACLGLLNVGVGQEAIREYKFSKYSKNQIHHSIECVFNAHSSLKVPPTVDPDFLIHRYSSPGTHEFNRWNADSVNFHFFIVSGKDSFLLWTRFSGLMDNWNEPETEFGPTGVLVIYGVSVNKSEWWKKGDSGFKRSDRKKAVKLFETGILPEVNEYLTNPCPPVIKE